MIGTVLHDGYAGIGADETAKPMGGAFDLVRDRTLAQRHG